ncbi:MAG: bifunctional non-ous end joining protein LigD [Tepidanaerobacteraceae bacterium]|nr:bifunctional non-ous end joining protein LigD [Tepidanaerobacteraceae bacterium]
MTHVFVGNRRLKLTNLSKVLWPDDGFTKADFIDYMEKVSPYILPHLKDRPVVFTRYPDGIYGKAFYQKNIPEYAPKWLNTYEVVSDRDKIIRYAVINDKDSLIWAANQASIEIHPWLSRKGAPGTPDFAVFDFDPMEKTDFEDARRLALALKRLLDMEGLKGFVKTSGATGLQVYIPLEPVYTYEDVRIFTSFFCRVLEKAFPDDATTTRKVDKRGGRVYLDYLQNIRGKTIIAPYSPRPRKGAPVSCPLTWEELEEGVAPDMFTIKSVPERLNRMGDVFAGALIHKQRIDKWLK